ncbi:MAG TPA: cupin domain-containing protein [Puia sp.]|nr:cupin domain-containing protein [Puia sp.]
MNPVVSRLNPLKHYLWGDNCDGWNLVDQPGLSVKMERMPPHTAEESHYHELARQFFFILKGVAVFEFTDDLGVGEDRVVVAAQQGLEIAPLLRHRIINETEEDLEFILCSQPSTAGDRRSTNDKI